VNERNETGRIEAFSDGIFAIAITLLVLELIPIIRPDEGQVFEQIIGHWPIFLAFFTSFIVIGIMWLNHHYLFNHILRADHVLILFNLGLLLFITIVPFSTAVLGEYFQDAATHPELLPQAAALYSGTFILTAIFFNALWRYATHKHRLLEANIDPQAVKKVRQQYLFGPFLYGIAFAIAFFSPLVSVIINAVLAIFFLLPGGQLQARSHIEAPPALREARE
jgi:uncharacterized membrane protein